MMPPSLPLSTPKLALIAEKVKARLSSSLFLWICGVILPLAAVLFEAVTAFCAGFIDPMPTLWHLALLLAIPWCNAAAWLALRRDAFEHRRLFAAMTGFSASVSLFYSVLFAPIMPFALIGLLVGLPILAFAPLLSLWTALKLARQWRDFAGTSIIVTGALCGFGAILLLAWPAIALRAGATMMHSERAWLRDTGFYLLRLDAVREDLLKACHARSQAGARESVALLAGRGPLQREEARELYYFATGRSYQREPVSLWHRRAFMQFDENRGSDRVGTLAGAVSLAASRLDGRIDPHSAIAYFEYTLDFHNSSAVQQEARLEMALPQGGVVSRATLWIHGAEREATFGERSQVRRAYESVVRVRRDPLLVTTAGRDRVLAQCFPIEPNGDMKIRLGITAPILPEGAAERGVVVMPAILDRNFDARRPPSVWIESPAGTIRNYQSAIGVAGMKWQPAYTPDTAGIVEQRFVERAAARPEGVVVVVDGSESMQSKRREIESAFATFPSRILVATRAGVEPWPSTTAWRGGVDPVPALQKASELAMGTERSAIVWVAGEQPFRQAAALNIRQMLERTGGRVKLYVVAGGSTNAILRELDGAPGVETVSDLRTLLARWHAGRERVVERKLIPSASPDAEPGSSHIARLWAAESKSVKLAIAHQVVTPLTGAVVLETAAQYAQNGLEPSTGSNVPTMPEPETVGLLAVGAIVAAWLTWRRRACASS